MKLILTILGVGSCVAFLPLRTGGVQLASDNRFIALTSCQATARAADLDGQTVVIAGRYRLNPASSDDAPTLIRDITGCEIAGAQGAVIADTSHAGNTPGWLDFEKYRRDLISTPCPPKVTCIPEKIARHPYIDIVARGRFKLIPPDQRDSAYCCQLTIYDMVSVRPDSEAGRPGFDSESKEP